MPLTLSGSGGITYPDGSVNATRSVSTAGDTMTGPLVVPAGATETQAPRLSDVWAKGGSSGISGWFTTTINSIDGNGGIPGTYNAGTTSADKFGWQLLANVSLDNPGSGGTQYVHMKTNYASTSAMLFFHLEGYAYNYGNVDTKMGLYMYTGSIILNTFITNSGNGVNWHTCYKAGADGKLVLAINLGQTGYTSARGRLWVCGQDDSFNWNNIKIESSVRTNSGSAQW